MTAPEVADASQDKAIEIVINGRKRTVDAKELSFQEIVNLAFDQQSAFWSRRHHHGHLPPGEGREA